LEPNLSYAPYLPVLVALLLWFFNEDETWSILLILTGYELNADSYFSTSKIDYRKHISRAMKTLQATNEHAWNWLGKKAAYELAVNVFQSLGTDYMTIEQYPIALLEFILNDTVFL
jgi:hypothetical protein